MQVKGRQYEKLNRVLVDAFDRPSLTMMLKGRLDITLANIVEAGAYFYQVFQLIGHFNRKDRVEDLILAAQSYNPTHGELNKLSLTLNLTTPIVYRSTTSTRPETELTVEKLANRNIPLLDEDALFDNMLRTRRRVCVIERKQSNGNGKPLGSGLLIGSHTVLTNYHVVQGYLNGTQAQYLQVRFDALPLQPEQDEREPNDGVTFDITAIPIWSERGTMLPDVSPNADQLDFAILCLNNAAGYSLVCNYDDPKVSLERGWFTLPNPDPTFEENTPLIIYQYPGGRELKVSIDTAAVVAEMWGGLRVRYRNNTKSGSSGSPVLNFSWQLVALHHASGVGIEPVPYNQGVPIATIARYVHSQGQMALFGRKLNRSVQQKHVSHTHVDL